MQLSDYLSEEWKPALGCTEPASIALAASSAAAQSTGPVESVTLLCDPRIYKNCYAVGIPFSDHKVGIRWALAIGSLLPDPSLELECFRNIDNDVLEAAAKLMESGEIHIEVDSGKEDLFIDCRVVRSKGQGRAVIENEHTRLVHLEKDSRAISVKVENATQAVPKLRAELADFQFEKLIELAGSLTPKDRLQLRRGIELNMEIARHGLSLFPERFTQMGRQDPLSRISRRVCAGVYARMCGEDFSVMSLAGSGNKGIVCAVPLNMWAQEIGKSKEAIDQALALACLVTSSTTHHLGTLSAVCGCSNAAGIGLAAGLTFLEGGGPDEISMSVNNMVGNVTGMICDGAKIGCALKTMTSVDAAFRAASLALSGIGIPFSDGIVGRDGMESLANLGKIATLGMAATDTEILKIMQAKLRSLKRNK
ncbi:MAG: serine dehydratase subunit alpha family protein [Deltaproteobacteria bacterium]|nr:serine dehydratase subunit alpha family protein [Deltaproteobacteria bacterium]